MKTHPRYLLAGLFALMLSAPMARATDAPPEPPAFSQQELDEMLAPIALYPDSLLSQIFMAATYPLEVVEAARWSRANTGLQGEQAVRAVDNRDWDPSVKSLVAFPRILGMMDEKLEWTESLGDAFLGQSEQLMDTVQGLRSRAYAAGNLRSNEYYDVQQQGRTLVIQQPSPEVVYVPYYDPVVVYGAPWWPAFRPVFWRPWPAYRYRGHFAWSVGVHVGRGFFYGGCDWRSRHVTAFNAHPFYYHGPQGRPIPPRHSWVHEAAHRRGVPYRQPDVRHRYADNVHGSPGARREGAGRYTTMPVNRTVRTERPREGSQVGNHGGNASPWRNASRDSATAGQRPDAEQRNDGRRFTAPQRPPQSREVTDGPQSGATKKEISKDWRRQNDDRTRAPGNEPARVTAAPRSGTRAVSTRWHEAQTPTVQKVDFRRASANHEKAIRLPERPKPKSRNGAAREES